MVKCMESRAKSPHGFWTGKASRWSMHGEQCWVARQWQAESWCLHSAGGGASEIPSGMLGVVTNQSCHQKMAKLVCLLQGVRNFCWPWLFAGFFFCGHTCTNICIVSAVRGAAISCRSSAVSSSGIAPMLGSSQGPAQLTCCGGGQAVIGFLQHSCLFQRSHVGQIVM